jgi:hypothetical protein
MKRELAAYALLIVMIALLLFNIRTLDALIEGVETHVCRSSAALLRGESNLAVSELETAMALWHEAEPYTHIFVRHSEVDAVADAFFDLSDALRGGEATQREAYRRLLYHLDSIGQMDHLRLGSIF